MPLHAVQIQVVAVVEMLGTPPTSVLAGISTVVGLGLLGLTRLVPVVVLVGALPCHWICLRSPWASNNVYSGHTWSDPRHDCSCFVKLAKRVNRFLHLEQNKAFWLCWDELLCFVLTPLHVFSCLALLSKRLKHFLHLKHTNSAWLYFDVLWRTRAERDS